MANRFVALPPVAAVLQNHWGYSVFHAAQICAVSTAAVLGARVGVDALIKYKISQNTPLVPGMYETLANLPDDVWHQVATQLPFKDQRVLRLVSRQFNRSFENNEELSSSERNIVQSQAESRRVKDKGEPGAIVAEAERTEASAIYHYKTDNWNSESRIFHRRFDDSFGRMASLTWPRSFDDLPIMNWKLDRPIHPFYGIGALNYFDPLLDYTAPLMRGYDETVRPFIAALVVVENMEVPSVEENVEGITPIRDIGQIVLYQAWADDFSKARKVPWKATLKGGNLMQLKNKLSRELPNQDRLSLIGRLTRDVYIDYNLLQGSLRVLLTGGIFTETDGSTLRLFRSMDEVRSHQNSFPKQSGQP